MATLEQLVEAVYKREGAIDGETLLVANHVQQMKEFGRRKGVEFYPQQDDDKNTRFKFISSLCKQNKLDLYLDRFWDVLLCKGQMLFYLRPTKNTYRIYWYPKESFKAFYDGDGELVEVTIVYSYKVRAPMSGMAETEKWLKLKITKSDIWRTESDQALSLESELEILGVHTEKTENTLGFIPCVVVNNYVLEPGQDGIDEFSWLKTQIESLDEMERGVKDNLGFFSNPILVATRSPGELTEAGFNGASVQRPTISSQSGFYSPTMASTRKSDPTMRTVAGQGIRLRKVIGNVRPEERFGFVAADAVSGDHNTHIDRVREQIRIALGGVDEIGIHSGATAFEIKSLFGRAAATADRKAMSLYSYGICKILEFALIAEEKLFKESLAQILEGGYAKSIGLKLQKDVPVIEQLTNEIIQGLADSGYLPTGTIGLIPNGDTTVIWRHTGPVFEDSTQDRLNKSIMVRNLQELGVASPEALQVLFPEMTDTERMQMLTGIPFRMGGNIISLINQVLGLVQELNQMPDPYNNSIPLGNRIDITPVLQKCVQSLVQELSYGKQYDESDANLQPKQLPAPAARAALPGTRDSSNATESTIPTGASYPGALGQSAAYPYQPGFGDSASVYWGSPNPIEYATTYAPSYSERSQYPTNTGLEGSIQQGAGTSQYSGVQPEWSSPLPTAGGTLNSSSATSQPGSRTTTVQPLQPTTPITTASIPADLSVQPGLLQQLFPTFSSLLPTKSKSGKSKPRGKG